MTPKPHELEHYMTTPKPERRSAGTPAAAPDQATDKANAPGRVSGAMKIARSSATMVVSRVPGTVHATRVGASGATSALRSLPDSTLRWLAASSVGLGAGMYLAGKPRLLIAAGMAPAVFMGAAIVGRPAQPPLPTKVR
jgi:hypothetical protein